MNKRYLSILFGLAISIVGASQVTATTLPETLHPSALAIEAGNTNSAISALLKLPQSNERDAMLALAYKLKRDSIRSFYYSKRTGNLDEAAFQISSFYLERASVDADARQMVLKLGRAVVESDIGDGLAWLAELYEARGSDDGAMQLYSLGHEVYPKNARIVSGLGEQYLKRGEADRAIIFFTRAHLLEPGKPSHMIGLGRAFYKSGRPDRALELWNKALVVEPSNAALYKDIQKVTSELNGTIIEGTADVGEDALATDPSGLSAPPTTPENDSAQSVPATEKDGNIVEQVLNFIRSWLS